MCCTKNILNLAEVLVYCFNINKDQKMPHFINLANKTHQNDKSIKLIKFVLCNKLQNLNEFGAKSG